MLDGQPLPELMVVGGNKLAPRESGDNCIAGIPCFDDSAIDLRAREQGRTLILISLGPEEFAHSDQEL